MEASSTLLPTSLPVFGNTRLEKAQLVRKDFKAQFMVKVPFLGVANGELRMWSDLDMHRLRPQERAYARGILLETANILAGVTLSELADRLDGRIMLAPPTLNEKLSTTPNEGTDYHLHLLDGRCNCRVELLTGENA